MAGEEARHIPIVQDRIAPKYEIFSHLLPLPQKMGEGEITEKGVVQWLCHCTTPFSELKHLQNTHLQRQKKGF